MTTLDVGIDLDGCFYWFHRAYVAGCWEIGALHTEAPMLQYEDLRWDFYTLLGHTTEEFVANSDTLADRGLLWAGPAIAGTMSVWDDLVAAGHRIHVKTDRRFGSHPVASEVGTIAWLRAHNRTYESLTFTADKTAGPRCDVMVEDKLENYDALAASSCAPVLLNRPWNQVPGDTRWRVDDMEQFGQIVHHAAVVSSYFAQVDVDG